MSENCEELGLDARGEVGILLFENLAVATQDDRLSSEDLCSEADTLA